MRPGDPRRCRLWPVGGAGVVQVVVRSQRLEVVPRWRLQHERAGSRLSRISAILARHPGLARWSTIAHEFSNRSSGPGAWQKGQRRVAPWRRSASAHFPHVAVERANLRVVHRAAN